MEKKSSTKKHLLSLLNECDLILKEFLNVLATNEEHVNPIKLLDLLLSKDEEMKALIPCVNNQLQLQKKLDYIKAEIAKRDKVILSQQVYLRKSEIILNCALYYSRKKLEVISSAVANPVDPEEVIRFGHKLTTKNGVLAPHDWLSGDKRRPYPTEDIWKRGFLKFLNNDGEWNVSGLTEYVAENRMWSQQHQQSQQQQQQHQESNATAVSIPTTPQDHQQPPGVNIVSSPAMSTMPGGTLRPLTPAGIVPTAPGVSPGLGANMTPPSVRPMAPPTQSQDDVGLITDSSNSSDTDGY